MRRVLVLIGNKVLVSEKDEVLIPFENMSDTALAEELQLHYAVNTIRIDSFPEWNFYAVTAAPQKKLHCQSVSIASAIKKIDAHEYDIRNYLNLQRLKLSVKLQYGVRDGKIVHISDIPRDQNGLACNCTCPGCGMSLQARIGLKKQKHFAHNNESCDTTSAQQTALHMLAKEIIETEKQLLVPGVTVTKEEIYHLINKNLRDVFVHTLSSWEYKPAKTVNCSSVLLEKRLSDIIPDIVIDVAGRICLVEIAVTHFVDEGKRAKVKELGLPLFEIDLSSLYGGEMTKDSIRSAVLHQTDNRRWIYNPLKEDARKWAADKYNIEAQKTLDKLMLEERLRIERELQKQQKREQAQEKLDYLFLPDVYKQTLESFRDDKQVFSGIKNLFCHRELSANGIPFYLDLPITGEIIFKCDRRIWQSMLFDKFIYNRKASDSTVHLKRVEKWLTDFQKEIPIDWTIAYRTDVHLGSSTLKSVRLLTDVVKRFFEYMAALGFLSKFSYHEAKVQSPRTLLPPNNKEANRLEAILHSVDITAPNVDELIDQGLRPAITRWSPSRGTLSSAVEKIQLQGKIDIAERELCFEQIKDSDFEGKEPIIDKIGFRWFLCTNCGNIFREDEMADYGGPNRVNKGLCQKCSKHC